MSKMTIREHDFALYIYLFLHEILDLLDLGILDKPLEYVC